MNFTSKTSFEPSHEDPWSHNSISHTLLPMWSTQHSSSMSTKEVLRQPLCVAQADPELFLEPVLQPSWYWVAAMNHHTLQAHGCFFNPPSHPHGLHMAWTRPSPSFLESSNCFLLCLSPHFLKYSEVSLEASSPTVRTPRTTLPTALFSKPLTRETAPNSFSSFFIDSLVIPNSRQVQKTAGFASASFLLSCACSS